MVNSSTPPNGWRQASGEASLPEVYQSVRVPRDASFFRKLFAYMGPGFMAAVGYMDPGNWATDLAGGSRFGYSLLSVIMISTSNRTKMGVFANPLWINICGWLITATILVLNAKLLFDTFAPQAVLDSLYGPVSAPMPSH